MKRLHIKLVSAALLSWAIAVPASGQEEWTLRRCIDHALEHNLSVRSGELAVAAGEIELNSARSSRLPGVSASASQNFSFGRGLTADNTYDNSNTTSTGFNLGADVPVFQGFRIKHNIALQKLNLAAATADLAKAKDDIRVAVAQAFVQVLYNEEILDVARSQVGIDSLQAERMEAMHSSGKASLAEVAAQKAALSQSRYQEVQARTNLELALLELSQLLELDSPEGFSISRGDLSEELPPLPGSPQDIYEEAVGVRPSILAEELRLGAADTQIDLARGQRLPSLSLSGGIGTNYYTSSNYASSSFSDQMKNNFSQYVGLSLSVPIFSRFSTSNSIRSAEVSRDRSSIALENARKSLYKEIQQAWYNAVSCEGRLSSSEDVVRSSNEAFELARAKYESGKSGITEFNEAKNNLMKAESDLVQARWQARYQRALLDFYRSGEIDF